MRIIAAVRVSRGEMGGSILTSEGVSFFFPNCMTGAARAGRAACNGADRCAADPTINACAAEAQRTSSTAEKRHIAQMLPEGSSSHVSRDPSRVKSGSYTLIADRAIHRTRNVPGVYYTHI